jgi:serine phosphatase RsbU (regulator of sigma subunit)
VIEDFAYETRYRDLAPGQWVCVLTDGVTEAMNAARELFGVARVTEALQSIPDGADVGGIMRHVHERVVAYVGDAAVADDLTLLVLRWNGPISAVPVEDDEAELADVDLDAPVAGLGDAVGRLD